MTEAVWRYWVSKIQRGDRDTEQKALLELEGFLAAIVKSWSVPGSEFDELLQEARIAALDALRTYDEGYASRNGGQQASLKHYVRRIVSNRLGKIKAAEKARREGADDESDVDESAAPAKSSESLDTNLIRTVFPYLTAAERRGLIAMLEESGATVVASNTAVTKQAISRGWRSAHRLIVEVQARGPAALAARRLVGALPDDWRLDEVLSK
ncbi:MAG: hypothetical protein ABFD60_04275 [Bryobacteraceae bacterium]